MTDDPPRTSRDEAELLAALRTGAWPRAEPLATPAAWARAREEVALTRDPREAWRRLGGFPPTEEVVDAERLFHLKAPWARAAAVRVALCPSPGVPKARCVGHPVTVRDAVAFGLFGARLRTAEALARAAADAIDAVGQATAALAQAPTRAAPRRAVWRTSRRARPRANHRGVVLLTELLLGDARRPLPPVAALRAEMNALQLGHNEGWGRARTVAIGALAWRAGVADGSRMTAASAAQGSRFFVRPEVVGRPLADLADPFEPLAALGAMGVSLFDHSHEAVVLELQG